MKRIINLFLVLPVLAFAQSQNQNYIKNTTYKVATTLVSAPSNAQIVQSITYFDGMGRPIQQIAVGQSAMGNNLVTPITYDLFGRQDKDYLPIAMTGNSLAFADSVAVINDPSGYYTNTYGPDGAFRYSQKKFDGTMLNRVLEQGAPGSDWALDNNHTIKLDYQVNAANDVTFYKALATYNLATQLYDVVLTAGATPHYAAGTLYKSVIKDENWVIGSLNTTEEFKNQEGQVVLKKTYNQATNGPVIPHNTFYVYDQFGNLSFVIPPKATDPLLLETRNNLCYQYKYDSRNRVVEKKLPGKQWEYIVYDKLDRIVATGPAFSPFINEQINQTASNPIQGWLVTKYDVYNRPVYTGWHLEAAAFTSTLRSSKQTIISGLTALHENKLSNNLVDGVNARYSNTVILFSTPLKLLTVNYYDNYDFIGAPSSYDVTLDGVNQVFYNNTAPKPRGLPTGSWVRVLESSTAVKAEISYTLYDKKARPVKGFSTNHLGGYITTESKLDFIGKTLYTITMHKKDAASPILQVREDFTYSVQDRLLTHTHKIGNLSTQLLARNEYDEMGQLIRKSVGGTDVTGVASLQKINYNYNIRGWLKSINDVEELTPSSDPTDLFAFKINYNQVTNDLNGIIKPLFNGNISETFWKTDTDNIKRNYGYQYDNLNRLTNAIYQKENFPTNSYNEKLTYDPNGNIMTLHRNGFQDGSELSTPFEIDDLVYGYAANSNRLLSVHDQSNKLDGFKDGNLTGIDYEYDLYGNMNRDKNKKILTIRYNHLNLPTWINFDNGSIHYLYNAVGVKLAKFASTTSTTQSTLVADVDYLGGFQYSNNELQFFPTTEGYVSVTDGNVYNYVFNYTDHLGNIRVSYSLDQADQQLKILQENHYYPFGLKHSSYNTDTARFRKDPGGFTVILRPVERSDYQYKYNGKEFQDELGLNFYDYGARNYDAAIGRWMSIDPLAEKYFDFSTYTYALNNPIFFIDPDGREVDVSALADSKKKDDQWLLVELMASLSKASGGMTISKSVDKNGKTTLAGSGTGDNQTAKYISHLLTMDQTITVGSTDKGSGAFPTGEVNLNAAQINGMQKGLEKKGINKNVMSVGMAFLHETAHTEAGANWWKKQKSVEQKDGSGRFLDNGDGAGNVDNRINGFRQESDLATLYSRSQKGVLFILVNGKKVEVEHQPQSPNAK